MKKKDDDIVEYNYILDDDIYTWKKDEEVSDTLITQKGIERGEIYVFRDLQSLEAWVRKEKIPCPENLAEIERSIQVKREDPEWRAIQLHQCTKVYNAATQLELVLKRHNISYEQVDEFEAFAKKYNPFYGNLMNTAICFWNKNFGGAPLPLGDSQYPDFRIFWFGWDTWNDDVSSIRNFDSWAIFYAHSWFRGARLHMTPGASHANLLYVKRGRKKKHNWNDCISSAKISKIPWWLW